MSEPTSRPSPVLKSSHLAWGFIALLAVLLVFNWGSVYPVVREVVLGSQHWYGQLFANLVEPVQQQAYSAFPFVAPFLLGLLAATAPCQLSSGAASLAFVVHDPQPGSVTRRAGAFLLGRVTLFVLLGLIVALVCPGQFKRQENSCSVYGGCWDR
ncbi:hypothetical protein [Deinococcus peraridilitoris]|uniref:Cytochrome C biogenesis protein transmembrane region n=1 Tax=Deinococcus peraridilitoris (strain DSM 19664 / LMG 22246 / CIP 109416 / KR-200) TaxID=937777 RepID=L0A609_DEIPD|nr:hypothetical protein [Deinococcus peraridilitoris]AFZ69286.1 hypothetical protein Deipe_3871 [Deinococcus peraridilitoris DSM 19664]